jgi:hypothetical protein
MNLLSIGKDPLSIKILNFICSVSIILTNTFFFIPQTYLIFRSDGGPFGVGILFLPISLIGILFLIPASLTLRRKN